MNNSFVGGNDFHRQTLCFKQMVNGYAHVFKVLFYVHALL